MTSNPSKRKKHIPHNCVLRVDLATQLFPAPTPRQAVAKMHYWVSGDQFLLKELKRAGYRSGTHFLKQSVVRVFKEYFG